MPANGLFKNFTREGNGGSGNSRQRSILIAVLIAIIAFVLIFIYVHNHNSNKSSSSAPTTMTVLVANANIPVDTSYATIKSQNLLTPETVKTSAAQSGAITSIDELSGSVSKTLITKGQQVTTSDFVVTGQGGVSGLTGAQRAITLSLDAEHGQTALLQANDHVDVVDFFTPPGASRGEAQLIATNLVVLQSSAGAVTLEVTQGQTLLLAAAQSSGALWLMIRGQASTSPIRLGSIWKAPNGS